MAVAKLNACPIPANTFLQCKFLLKCIDRFYNPYGYVKNLLATKRIVKQVLLTILRLDEEHLT